MNSEIITKYLLSKMVIPVSTETLAIDGEIIRLVKLKGKKRLRNPADALNREIEIDELRKRIEYSIKSLPNFKSL